jgi:hypothetical protein
MVEPIRQVSGDGTREQKVAHYLSETYSWDLYSTPKYYFIDFLVNKNHGNGYANYIGGLEVKWMKRPVNSEVKFPYQKLQQIWLTEPTTDRPDAFNRICIRYTDALLLIPAHVLRCLDPIFGLTRSDTNEHDFNVHFNAAVDFPDYILPVVIDE